MALFLQFRKTNAPNCSNNETKRDLPRFEQGQVLSEFLRIAKIQEPDQSRFWATLNRFIQRFKLTLENAPNGYLIINPQVQVSNSLCLVLYCSSMVF